MVRHTEDNLGIAHSWGSGPEVIFLSNPLADPVKWSAEARRELVSLGYRVTTFEHRPAVHDWQNVVACVSEFVNRRDEPVSLVGWSQGAAIAQEVALEAKDRIQAAALLATYGRQNEIDKLLQRSWDHLAEDGSDDLRATLRLLTAFPADRLSEDEFIRSLMSPEMEWSVKPDPDLRRRAATFIETYQDRLSALSALRIPCLVMGFELDTDTFAARAREVAAALPHGRYLELSAMGHAAPISDPGAVWPPVVDFLAHHHPSRGERSRWRNEPCGDG